MKLQELLSQRDRLIANMRTMLDAGIKTAEDDATYSRYEKEEVELEKQIQRAEKLEKTEAVMREVVETPVVTKPESRAEDKRAEDKKRYTEAFETLLRTPMMNLDSQTRAVLNTGTGSEGGYLVPEEYLTTVINKLLDINVMRQISDVIRTQSTTNIPLGDGRPSFAIIAENGAYGTTDASFGQVVLGAYKLGGIIQASDELVQDAFIDIQSYLTNLIVDGVADAEETYFTTGTGTGQAQGITIGGSLGKTTVAVGAVTIDEMLDLEYSLKSPYRMNAGFVMNSNTELALRKLKDSQGQYLWEQSLQVGAPNVFDGKAININEKMPDLGTGNKFAAFGDFSYFKIADRGGLEIKRLDELYAANGQTGWRISKRFDSRVTQSEAIKYAQNA